MLPLFPLPLGSPSPKSLLDHPSFLIGVKLPMEVEAKISNELKKII